MKCGEIMTQNPECCEPETSVIRAAQLMDLKDVGPLPIVDEVGHKRMIGIVTDRDLALKVVGRGKDPHRTRVGEVMSRAIVTCRPDDDIVLALKMMELWKIRRIPVVTEDGVLVGIITQGDIVTRLRDPLLTQELLERVSVYH